MPEITRSQLVVYAVIALVITLLGARSLRGSEAASGAEVSRGTAKPGSAPGPVVRRGEADPEGVVVHVAGAVRHPGVYRVRSGGRVRDAVRRAGGATAGGEANAINLAAKVVDGQQVVIPRRVPVATNGSTSATATAPAGTASLPAAPVSLSSATPEQLQELDGVGPATAAKIVAWRTEHGGFRSIDDLGQVPGIGAKRLATLRPLVQP